MELVTVKKTLNVSGGVVGINPDQARRRAHNLEECDEQPKLREGFTAYAVLKPVQFKIGEKLYVEEITKVANPFVVAAASGAKAASADDGKKDADAEKAAAKAAAAEKKKAKAAAKAGSTGDGKGSKDKK